MDERVLVHVDVCPCKRGRMLVEHYSDGTVTLAPKAAVVMSFRKFPGETNLPGEAVGGSGTCTRKLCRFLRRT